MFKTSWLDENVILYTFSLPLREVFYSKKAAELAHNNANEFSGSKMLFICVLSQS